MSIPFLQSSKHRHKNGEDIQTSPHSPPLPPAPSSTITTDMMTTSARMHPTTLSANATVIEDGRTYLDRLRDDGFVVIPSILPPHLLLALQATSTYLASKARQGEWPHVRTVPKQYPPWQPFQPGDNIWGVQHLLHPDMPVRDVYAEVYFCDEVLDVVKELLELPPRSAKKSADGEDGMDEGDEGLVMELFNLLISPGQKVDFELAWHRDDVRPDVSSEEEARQLAIKSPQYRHHNHRYVSQGNLDRTDSEGVDNTSSQSSPRQLHAQYNISLFDNDDSLLVIPGSHARTRTEIERNADPYEPDLPSQQTVILNAGDAVFYDSNILHRAVYKGIDLDVAARQRGRMTLHGSVGLAGHGDERARQVLQHAVGNWVGRIGFPALQGRKRRCAKGMRDRLVAMGTGEGLGYSLEG